MNDLQQGGGWREVTPELLIAAGCVPWPFLPEHYEEIARVANALASRIEEDVWQELLLRGS